MISLGKSLISSMRFVIGVSTEPGKMLALSPLVITFWGRKRKKINSLSLLFIHPETLQICCIPVVILPPLGHDSNLLFQTCKDGVDRVNVEEKDIFRLVNDNCSTAKRTGRILLCYGDKDDKEEKPDGFCDMCFANLYSVLALSCNMLCGRKFNQSLGFLSGSLERGAENVNMALSQEEQTL